MKNSDEQEARTESERALQEVILSIMSDNMELFKQFQDNPSFRKWLSGFVFNLTYNKEGKPYELPKDTPELPNESQNRPKYRKPHNENAPDNIRNVADDHSDNKGDKGTK